MRADTRRLVLALGLEDPKAINRFFVAPDSFPPAISEIPRTSHLALKDKVSESRKICGTLAHHALELIPLMSRFP